MDARPSLLPLLLSVLLLVTGSLSCSNNAQPPEQSDATDKLPAHPLHTDHSTFFQSAFPDGPAVTQACLECHPSASAEIMKTTHWNWLGEEVIVPGHAGPARIGKRNLINNFCIGVQSNWPACTMCHIGYGWEDENFDFTDPTRVDCLVCHDHSGTYLKKFRAAGVPDESVDLLKVARSVGVPLRQNCGSCHFQAGGGNAAKHGDMDETLLFPSSRIDVHMGKNNMHCIDCHRTVKHQIRGRAMSVSVDKKNRVHCTDCHAAQPHNEIRLNLHTGRVACQACHVPYIAPDTGTKMTWDWSEAGQDLDISDEHQYLKIKGRFTWAKKVKPEYHWYNETSTRYIIGDRIDPSTPTRISAPLGERADPTAKLWPFKVHRGKQPYDAVHKYFLVPHVHGDQGFWTAFDWPTALKVGSRVTGLPYSGSYDFAPTEMYFPLSHMVAAPDKALDCRDCHGERGRLDWLALGYERDPLYRDAPPHPPVYLFDANSQPVSESGEPLSITASCGICHNLQEPNFVATHGYHTSVEDDSLPPERRRLMPHGPRIPADADSQMNCFLCHIRNPDHVARMAAMASGALEWSVSATLRATGLIQLSEAGYRWNRDRIAADGKAALELQTVSEATCGACHGMVHDGSTPLLVKLGKGLNWTTEKTGQVFSPQRVNLSGMNLAKKDSLDMVWDVHSQRLVSCGDCHYSTGRPERLAGTASPADVAPAQGVKRRCESCHSLHDTHLWLPERKRHFKAVTCEACHVPRLGMAAQQSIDQTVMLPDGSPQIRYRGVDGDVRDASRAYIRGYRPLLQVGKTAADKYKVMPYNLVTRWYWTDGDNDTAIPDHQLRQAWLDGGHYAADVVETFDDNHDGQLSPPELRLDSEQRVFLIKARLRAAGVINPRVRGEIRAYPIHHSVRHGDQVNRDCAVCHPQDQAKLPSFELAPYLPDGVKPVLQQDSANIVLAGKRRTGADGRLLFAPTRGVAESWQSIENSIRSEP